MVFENRFHFTLRVLQVSDSNLQVLSQAAQCLSCPEREELVYDSDSPVVFTGAAEGP